jgi:DNA-binding XRE family transcriptional regulator
MELWNYLSHVKREDRTLTNKRFAKNIGISAATLSRIMNYKQHPSLDLAKKIEKETNGLVIWWQLLEICNDKMKKN